jgi:hypothetical protein
MVGTLIRQSSGPVISGTYTPTLTNSTNIDASTSYAARYIRVGSYVFVTGKIDVDATAAGATITIIGISLPIASDLTVADGQLGGVLSIQFNSGGGVIFGDTANNRATAVWTSSLTANTGLGFSFSYVVQ